MGKFREWLLAESKQDIENLGYPKIIAKMLYEKFGKNSHLIAKWFREYRFSREVPENWWMQAMGSWYENPSLNDIVELHASTGSEEEYVKALDKLDLHRDEDQIYDDYYLQQQKEALEEDIKDKFLGDIFFNYYSLIQDIASGKIKNVAPYKKLGFNEAQHKYDEKNIFQDKDPVKTYRNGLKWIDVGKKCSLVGHLMKNCGSAGVMSADPNRTILGLFDAENKPHVVVTYSPNQKRISGDEGVASTAVKTKYHRYILDLAKHLGANFDAEDSKSKLLKMKYLLRDKAKNIRQTRRGTYDNFFSFKMPDGEYVSDGHAAIRKEDLSKAQEAINQGQIKLRFDQGDITKNVFNKYNTDQFARFGVNYIPLSQFSQPQPYMPSPPSNTP